MPIPRWTGGTDIGRLLRGVLVAVLVVATIWAGRDLHEPVAGFGIVGPDGTLLATNGNGLEVGDSLPPFRLLSTTDDVVELDDFEGQPLVIHLWNTWCLDCIADLPVIQQAADQWDGQVAVVGIAPDEPMDRVTNAANRHNASYTMLLDANEAVVTQYGATSLPVTIVVDGSGTVVAIHQGPIAFEDIERAVEPLLP
jgi:peroxiredoxin